MGSFRVDKRAVSWGMKMLLITLSISLFLSIVSEYVIDKTGTIVSLLVILFFMALTILCDIVSVAAAGANFEQLFLKSQNGVKEAKFLKKHADKVVTISRDIVGDISGILIGSAISALAVKFVYFGETGDYLALAVLSSVVAAVTVFVKSWANSYSIKNANQILLRLGKVGYYLKKIKKGR